MERRRVTRISSGADGQNRRHRPDYTLLILALILLGVGVVVVYAIGPGLSALEGRSGNYYISKQLLSVLLSLIAFGITITIPLKWWRKVAPIVAVLAVISSLVVIGIGLATHSPTRWITLGGISFQPAELIKLAAILLLGRFLIDRRNQGALSDAQKTFKPFAIAIGVIGIGVAFIMRDLGSAIVIVSLMVAMLYMSGFPMRRIALIGVAIVFVGLIAVASTPYRRDRFFAFLHPERDTSNTSYHINQALIAVGSGGLVGLGLGNSVQAYGYLPEAANDSIFAVYGEKFGFFGSVALVCVIGALLWRIIRIMEGAPDDYSRLVLVGIFAWLFIQSLMNIGAMIGLLPLKGITLPLVSYGGSSLVFVMIALGLVFQISRYSSLRLVKRTGKDV